MNQTSQQTEQTQQAMLDAESHHQVLSLKLADELRKTKGEGQDRAGEAPAAAAIYCVTGASRRE